MIPGKESRTWRWVAAAITVVAALGIVSTYHVFSNFYDEPAHVAAGMEWLDHGTFTLEPQHPPLSRVMAAVLPWIAGERFHGGDHIYDEGRAILGRGEHYQRMVTLARLGQLPFFFVLAFVVWYWTRRLSDERTAAVAVGLIACNPNILAHAGIAGTDNGPMAMMPAALLTWALWISHPTLKRSLLFGITLALCGLTKFSAGAYWVPAAVFVSLGYAAWRPGDMVGLAGARRMFRPFLTAFAAAAVTTWAAYRFHVGAVGSVTLPAPEFWIGLRDFFRHGTGGHPSYLLGQVSANGWWYYDIVVLLVKTPIPLIVLGIAGDPFSFKRLSEHWQARATATAEDVELAMLRLALHVGVIAVLLVATLTPVDLGIRLDLPVYAMVTVLAAMAVSALLASTRRLVRPATLALGAWMIATPLATYPDNIAYFNAFAGTSPEKVLVDSNLDWGQDLYRLRTAVREIGIDSIRVHYFGSADFAAVGLEHARRLRPNERANGWIAASETFYAGVWADSALNWLRPYTPVARAGRSIRLYYIVPGH